MKSSFECRYLNQLSLGSKQTGMIESETGHREAGFRPVQAMIDFFVSLLLIGVNIKKVVGRGGGGGCSLAAMVIV